MICLILPLLCLAELLPPFISNTFSFVVKRKSLRIAATRQITLSKHNSHVNAGNQRLCSAISIKRALWCEKFFPSTPLPNPTCLNRSVNWAMSSEFYFLEHSYALFIIHTGPVCMLNIMAQYQQ